MALRVPLFRKYTERSIPEDRVPYIALETLERSHVQTAGAVPARLRYLPIIRTVRTEMGPEGT
jgi:hypothetical protein